MILSPIFFFLFLLCVSNGFAACPSGTVEGPNGKFCYTFSDKQYTWDNAENHCLTLGGHLASVLDAFTNKFIDDNANKAWKNISDEHFTFWLGGCWANQWQWSDGSLFSYTNWYDNEMFVNYCVQQRLSDGQWVSNSANLELYYVCESKF